MLAYGSLCSTFLTSNSSELASLQDSVYCSLSKVVRLRVAIIVNVQDAGEGGCMRRSRLYIL